jgi:NADH-quinone oxidoreductase subunit F
MGPLVNIEPDGILYVRVKPADVPEIVERTLKKGELIDRLLYHDGQTHQHCKGQHEIPFYARQTRQTLKHCGQIDPADINEYVYQEGYRAAEKAVLQMSPEQVCAELKLSGLRGRGGGGFLTGRKLEMALAQPGPKKYIICNGDEGDPGAFMDRSVMEGNPHSVIEGMVIAGRAVGADEGYVYVRTEYPLAVERMKFAVAEAEVEGLLGDKIFGSDFSFHIHVMEGAGAFVCGEETALMSSIEGRRGMPNPKPPFPAQSGLWQKPTVINNVETLATVPLIILRGAQAFRSLGTPNSTGTKTFALTGHVANTGLIEVPFGTTLREIVFNIGGGVTGKGGDVDEKHFKAVQIGGPSGGCLTREHLDIPMDFDSLQGIGAMVGSGGLVVMNQDTCILQVARFFMQFAQNESCGKCVPCREGTRQMLHMLDEIIEGRGSDKLLKNLEELAVAVKKSSLCGLGKTAPNPVLSTLTYFRDEVNAHVHDKNCPAGKCAALRTMTIDESKCRGCTLCARKCPVNAIRGEVKKPHVIDAALCIKCGACIAACKFNAIA